jgi:hypothetical protein
MDLDGCFWRIFHSLWDSYGLREIPTTGGIMATLKSNQSSWQGPESISGEDQVILCQTSDILNPAELLLLFFFPRSHFSAFRMSALRTVKAFGKTI